MHPHGYVQNAEEVTQTGHICLGRESRKTIKILDFMHLLFSLLSEV